MGPKDKAEYLVQKFRIHQPVWEVEGDSKKCALIAIDEIITFGNQLGIREPMMYWKQVKEELENL
jgi:hypothetical protein